MTIEQTLVQIWNENDHQQLLTNPDFFLNTIASKYQPDFKADCKLMERGIRVGAGKITLQFIQQNAVPSASEYATFCSMLQQRAQFTDSEASRVVQLMSAMVGWNNAHHNAPRPAPQPAPTPAVQAKSNTSNTKIPSGLLTKIGILLIVLGVLGIVFGIIFQNTVGFSANFMGGLFGMAVASGYGPSNVGDVLSIIGLYLYQGRFILLLGGAACLILDKMNKKK